MNDREELANMLDLCPPENNCALDNGRIDRVLAWHTAKLNEARIDLLERVKSEQIPVMAMLDNKEKDWVNIQAIPLSALQKIEDEISGSR